jgi:hypothetical protein
VKQDRRPAHHQHDRRTQRLRRPNAPIANPDPDEGRDGRRDAASGGQVDVACRQKQEQEQQPGPEIQQERQKFFASALSSVGGKIYSLNF